jgi:hypothetical protein
MSDKTEKRQSPSHPIWGHPFYRPIWVLMAVIVGIYALHATGLVDFAIGLLPLTVVAVLVPVLLGLKVFIAIEYIARSAGRRIGSMASAAETRIHNERVKLLSSALNNLSVIKVGGAAFVPAAYGTLDHPVSMWAAVLLLLGLWTHIKAGSVLDLMRDEGGDRK